MEILSTPVFLAATVGWAITLGGWIITSRFSLGAQQRMFQHQILNNARLAITEAIRNHQDWLVRVQGFLFAVESARSLDSKDILKANWWQLFQDNIALQADPKRDKWAFALEEYEILFPETAESRGELVERDSELAGDLSASTMAMTIENERPAAIDKLLALSGRISDQIALLEDLRVYLQNVTLGSITGRAIAYRQPVDTSLPRLVVGQDGALKLVPSKGAPIPAG